MLRGCSVFAMLWGSGPKGSIHDPRHLNMYCVICWFEGTCELVDWFDSKAEATAEAKELNQQAEHSKVVSDDFFTAEPVADWT